MLTGQESAGLESEATFSEKVLVCFQARCAASYGPNVHKPNILIAHIAVQKSWRPKEDMSGTFDTFDTFDTYY